jgi:hypothetical protein
MAEGLGPPFFFVCDDSPQSARRPIIGSDKAFETIIGAAIDVNREFGPGLPESVYEV